MVILYWQLPTSFLPDEDQGLLSAQVQLPVGATDTRMRVVMKEVEKYLLAKPEIDSIIMIRGQGQNGAASKMQDALLSS